MTSQPASTEHPFWRIGGDYTILGLIIAVAVTIAFITGLIRGVDWLATNYYNGNDRNPFTVIGMFIGVVTPVFMVGLPMFADEYTIQKQRRDNSTPSD